MDEDELVPIILGQPFLATARAVIDMHEGKLSLRVGSETITFNIKKSMKSKHSRDDYLYCADHTAKLVQEQWVNTVNHDGKWTKEEEEDSNKALDVSFYPRTEPVEPLEWKSSKNRLKPSGMEPPRLELKELPEHLEYTFLQENNQLPVVISSALSTDKKTILLEVLRNHKGAIAWSITNIKGIDSWKTSSNQVSNLKDELPSTSRRCSKDWLGMNTTASWTGFLDTFKSLSPLKIKRNPRSPALTGPSHTNECPSDYAMPQPLFNIA
ncbi:hypothetical protein Tco_1131187 [Tanacetum coccineum]